MLLLIVYTPPPHYGRPIIEQEAGSAIVAARKTAALELRVYAIGPVLKKITAAVFPTVYPSLLITQLYAMPISFTTTLPLPPFISRSSCVICTASRFYQSLYQLLLFPLTSPSSRGPQNRNPTLAEALKWHSLLLESNPTIYVVLSIHEVYAVFM